MIGNRPVFLGSTSGNGSLQAIPITYAELLVKLEEAGTLVTGQWYEIIDFETIYDQPDFDEDQNPKTSVQTKSSGVEESLLVLAISPNKISSRVFSTLHPNDYLEYDVWFHHTEAMNAPAKGRISKRVDEFNNTTDYDHRYIKFKRYETAPGSEIYTSYWDTGGDFQEFLTFALADGSNTAYNNHIGNYANIFDYYGEPFILSNNVFGIYAERNNLRDYCYNNHFGNNCSVNEMQTGFISNKLGNGFLNNIFASDAYNNVIDESFANNNVSRGFGFNLIGVNCSFNYFNHSFRSNSVGYNFLRNIFHSSFESNVVGNEFQFNTVRTAQQISSIDFSAATHVYAPYTCDLISTKFNNNKLTFINGTPELEIVEITD